MHFYCSITTPGKQSMCLFVRRFAFCSADRMIIPQNILFWCSQTFSRHLPLSRLFHSANQRQCPHDATYVQPITQPHHPHKHAKHPSWRQTKVHTDMQHLQSHSLQNDKCQITGAFRRRCQAPNSAALPRSKDRNGQEKIFRCREAHSPSLVEYIPGRGERWHYNPLLN